MVFSQPFSPFSNSLYMTISPGLGARMQRVPTHPPTHPRAPDISYLGNRVAGFGYLEGLNGCRVCRLHLALSSFNCQDLSSSSKAGNSSLNVGVSDLDDVLSMLEMLSRSLPLLPPYSEELEFGIFGNFHSRGQLQVVESVLGVLSTSTPTDLQNLHLGVILGNIAAHFLVR